MIDPPPAAMRCGTVALAVIHTPVRLRSMTARQDSSVSSTVSPSRRFSRVGPGYRHVFRVVVGGAVLTR